jgi:glucokinase
MAILNGHSGRDRPGPDFEELQLDLQEKPRAKPEDSYGVALDMGASHLRFVLANSYGEILGEAQERVRSEDGPRGVIGQIREGITRFASPGKALLGIAIGVPGAVDPHTGKVFNANNVPGWQEVDMGQELEAAFHAPVFLDNDANMAAIGEYWRGVARGIDDFVFIALGTGIGAGVFVNGSICRGRSGSAGEIFRMNVDWTRWNEDFPDTGHLETYASGMGIAAQGRRVLPNGGGPGASPTLADERDARYVFHALDRGDPQARVLVHDSFEMLGVAVANVVSVLDPDLIVFNGGIVRGAPELLLETVGRVVRRIHPHPPSIQLSTLGDKAQIWGALHTLLEPKRQPAIRASQGILRR